MENVLAENHENHAFAIRMVKLQLLHLSGITSTSLKDNIWNFTVLKVQNKELNIKNTF